MGDFGKNLVDSTSLLAYDVSWVIHKLVRELIDKFSLPIVLIERDIGIAGSTIHQMHKKTKRLASDDGE